MRPTFTLDPLNPDELVLHPATDYDAFVRTQDDLIAGKFHGRRSRPRRAIATVRYANLLVDSLNARFGAHAQEPADSAADARLLAVNLKIIERLGREIAASGGQLIVVDASRYFGDSSDVSDALKHVAMANRFGYVPVYEDLLEANGRGVVTRWKYDAHFNVLASALETWIARQSSAEKFSNGRLERRR